jgi:hypothetical protein
MLCLYEMSEKKTIQINPELFRFSTNKTRKRTKTDGEPKPIRVKGQARPVSNKTAKRRLLKYIRQQQEKNYQQMIEGKPLASSENGEFESDFENSLKYLASVAEKNKQSVKHNQTLRHFPPSESLLFRQNNHNADAGVENDYVETELPDLFDDDTEPEPAGPKYGCLKNGRLPTYRMWKNQTQKTTPRPASNTHTFYTLSSPFQQSPVSQPSMVENYLASSSVRDEPMTIESAPLPPASNVSSFVRDKMEELKRQREIRERREKVPINLFRNRKQKKTTRRTFRVGKSKHYSQVAVLVSNKTLRKQVSTKIQLLKQVPIEDVRKTLVKKGLIRVGSSAPNDVLRKMFESTSLICGEVQNHNTENLLFNYLNGGM